MTTKRIPLSPGFHAEPGKTSGHLHGVYTTVGLPEGKRNWVGEMSILCVEAWAAAWAGNTAAQADDIDPETVRKLQADADKFLGEGEWKADDV